MSHGRSAGFEVVALDAGGVRMATPELPLIPDASRLPRGAAVGLAVAHPGALVLLDRQLRAAGVVPLLLNPELPRAVQLAIAESAGAAFLVHAQVEPVSATPRLFEGVARLVCTSGTTTEGAPKIFAYGEARMMDNARAHLRSVGFGERPPRSILLPMPLHHAFGVVAGLVAAEVAGATLFAFSHAPDPSTLLTVLEREAIELAYLTPPLARLLLRRFARRKPTALPSLLSMTVGSAGFDRGEARALMAAFPTTHVFSTYGLTELGPRVSTFAAGTHEAPSTALADGALGPCPLGEPLEGVLLLPRASDGPGGWLEGEEMEEAHGAEAAGPEDATELWVTSPHAALGRLTADGLEALPQPFPTRDALGHASDGAPVLLGRVDGTVVRGGTNVYSLPLELAAEAEPGVAGACLVGLPSALYGQVPVLFVEATDPSDGEALRARLLARMAERFVLGERPTDVILLPSLPRTALGKVKRRAVEALAKETHEL